MALRLRICQLHRVVGVLGLLTAIALVGCGGSAAKKPRPQAQTFTYADNGRTVTLGVSRRALVRLSTLNWTFSPITGTAVRVVGAQRLVYVTKGCNAPNGCGYVELTINAVGRGRSAVSANRVSCGEAERCAPNLRRFAVTVIVH